MKWIIGGGVLGIVGIVLYAGGVLRQIGKVGKNEVTKTTDRQVTGAEATETETTETKTIETKVTEAETEKTEITNTEVTQASETKTMEAEVINYIYVGNIDEVPEEGYKYFTMNTRLDGTLGEHKAILIHLPAELAEKTGVEFMAFSAVCTHQGCTVSYKGDDEIIACPCHGGRFDPATGEVRGGPPPRPIRRIESKIDEEGRIFAVRWA